MWSWIIQIVVNIDLNKSGSDFMSGEYEADFDCDSGSNTVLEIEYGTEYESDSGSRLMLAFWKHTPPGNRKAY